MSPARSTKTSREESEAYFHSRPQSSQIGAWASAQSEVVADRAQLERQFAEALAQVWRGGNPAAAALGRLSRGAADDRILAGPPQPPARPPALHAPAGRRRGRSSGSRREIALAALQGAGLTVRLCNAASARFTADFDPAPSASSLRSRCTRISAAARCACSHFVVASCAAVVAAATPRFRVRQRLLCRFIRREAACVALQPLALPLRAAQFSGLSSIARLATRLAPLRASTALRPCKAVRGRRHSASPAQGIPPVWRHLPKAQFQTHVVRSRSRQRQRNIRQIIEHQLRLQVEIRRPRSLRQFLRSRSGDCKGESERERRADRRRHVSRYPIRKRRAHKRDRGGGGNEN